MHQFIGIDVDDMSRGQGEWKNMQEVIRRSFRAVFEHMSNQQDQIKELNETISSLRQQLMIRPSTKEVTQLVESKVLLVEEKNARDDGGLSSLRAEVTDLRSSMERRATIRFVEDSLRRKLNKADIHLLSSNQAVNSAAPSPTFSDLMQVTEELKAKIERSEKKNVEARRHIGSFITQDDLAKALEKIENQLWSKANKAAVEKDLCRIEDVVADHEREIVTLALRASSFVSPHIAKNSQVNHLSQQRNLRTSLLLSREKNEGDDGTDLVADNRIDQLLQAGRDAAAKHDETARLEELERRVSDMQLSLAKLDNDKDMIVRDVQDLRANLEKHEQVIDITSSRVNDLGSVELSVEALSEQIRECRETLGTPFSIPLSSVLSHLEDRVADLDQVLHAHIVDNSNSNGTRQTKKQNSAGTPCDAIDRGMRQQLHTLSSHTDVIRDELSAKIILLESDVGALRDRCSRLEAEQKFLILSRDSMEKDDAKNEILTRMHALEQHCHMSGSGSIKTVQDMLNLVRTLRNVVAKLEDKVQSKNCENINIKKKMDGGKCHDTFRVLQGQQSKTDERLATCEIVERVHQTRINALEDSIYRFEKRQLKINDAYNRHFKALLKASSNSNKGRSEQVLDNRTKRQHTKKEGKEGFAYSFSKQMKSTANDLENCVLNQSKTTQHKDLRMNTGSPDMASSENEPQHNLPYSYYADDDTEFEISESGSREENGEYDDLVRSSSPSSASEDMASPISPHGRHQLLHQCRFQAVKSRSNAAPFSLVHPTPSIPIYETAPRTCAERKSRRNGASHSRARR